jgi:hypothetical protein
MRRKEIIEASQKILSAIRESHIIEAFDKTLREGPSEGEAFNAYLMSRLHEYSLLAKDYGPVEKQIADILHLSSITDSDKWPEVIYTKEGRPGTIFVWNRNLYFAINYLPLFLRLIEPGYLAITQKSAEELPDEYKGKALLTTILIEDSTHPPTADRIVDLVSSIYSLYETSSTILKHPIVHLTMVGCDSGGEKTFDFLGAAGIIQMVKEIIISLWDRIVFFRERQIAQRVELVAKSLPIINEIWNLENENKVGHEEAELLRRKLTDSAQKFITCGAVIPEMQERSTFDPHELMMPEPKLLEVGETRSRGGTESAVPKPPPPPSGPLPPQAAP